VLESLSCRRRPDVGPVAVSVWVPVRLAPKTTTVQKAPLVSVPLSKVMATVSPGRKPWPQKP
jgi:hypothetical protein